MHHYLKQKYCSFLKSSASSSLQVLVDSDKGGFRGKDIKKIRKAYNVSQRCFAAMLGISIKTLQNYEIDRRTIPGTARSLFIFANDNMDLFRKYYLSKVKHLEPYRESVNKLI